MGEMDLPSERFQAFQEKLKNLETPKKKSNHPRLKFFDRLNNYIKDEISEECMYSHNQRYVFIPNEKKGDIFNESLKEESKTFIKELFSIDIGSFYDTWPEELNDKIYEREGSESTPLSSEEKLMNLWDRELEEDSKETRRKNDITEK